MQRTKSTKEITVLPLWRNLSGTFTTAAGERIEAGGTFRADPKAISSFFRKSIVLVDETPEKKEEVMPDPEYRLRKRSTGWYDVWDKEGIQINDQVLSKPEAELLIAKLLG